MLLFLSTSKKAFNVIDHEIILRKTSDFGDEQNVLSNEVRRATLMLICQLIAIALYLKVAFYVQLRK